MSGKTPSEAQSRYNRIVEVCKKGGTMPEVEERLKEYFTRTGFDGIEVYYRDGQWICCIIEGCLGNPKPTINEAIVSAINEKRT